MKEKEIQALLVEDDPEDVILLSRLVSQPGGPPFRFHVECVENLKACFERLDRGGIDVVLLDLILADSQGIDTVRKVHAQFPDVPLVVLTGLHDESLGLEAVAHGAQDYLIKGTFGAQALKRTVIYGVERHRSLARLKSLIIGAADGMVVVDSKGRIQYMNPAAEVLFGQKADQMIDKPFPQPLSSDRSGEMKIPMEAGSERCVELRVSEIEWEGQSVSLASLRDITELRRIEQLKAEIKERRRMDKLKDELMSAVSHEMRSPLTIIKAAAANIREELTGPLSTAQRDMITLQYRNIERLEKIVDNILDLARLESGRAKFEPRSIVDLAPLIRETLSGVQIVAGQHHIMIQQDIDNGPLPVYADPELVVQVLSNLVDNAMRFAETKVLVRAENASPFTRISVIDDGQGIPENMTDDIFNKFVQVGRGSQKEGYKGTGLGLAICKEIVERQGGKIWVESRKGQGAQFHFTLPQYEFAPR